MGARAVPVEHSGVRRGNAGSAAAHVHDDATRGVGERDGGDRARATLHPGDSKTLARTPVQEASAAVLARRDGRTASGRQQLAGVARQWRCRLLDVNWIGPVRRIRLRCGRRLAGAVACRSCAFGVRQGKLGVDHGDRDLFGVLFQQALPELIDREQAAAGRRDGAQQPRADSDRSCGTHHERLSRYSLRHGKSFLKTKISLKGRL